MKLAVIFGGKSNEHKVSVVSGTSVIANLDKKKYEIYPIYINEDGLFFEYTKNINDIKILSINDEITELKKIDNIIDYLKDIDIIFPVLHGKYGEDGTIQGMFELSNKKYVGCHTLSSSLCMDKEYTKAILRMANINVAKGFCLKKYNDKYIYIDEEFNRQYLNKEEILQVIDNYHFPIFIKSANSGSSVGVNKVNSKEKFFAALDDSFKYDNKVLVEEGIDGREVECAILGNEDVLVSPLGEVLADDKFYSFDSKYKNDKINTIVPADIDENLTKKVQNIATKAYYACNCFGLSRIDFFIENKTNKIILNEINTMPGFTEISMYPKLIECLGISYSELLNKLIDLAK